MRTCTYTHMHLHTHRHRRTYRVALLHVYRLHTDETTHNLLFTRAANFSTDWVDLDSLNTYYRMWLQHNRNKIDKAVFVHGRVKEVRGLQCNDGGA